MSAEPKGPVGTREEKGSARGSHQHPPHVSENADEAPVQGSGKSKEAIPTLPPNAHGTDRVDPEEGGGIDEESMYSRRPSQDKDRPPSSPKVP